MKRDSSNKIIFGVCSGLAKEFGIDPIIVRLIFFVFTLMGVGFPILIYLILAILMPSD